MLGGFSVLGSVRTLRPLAASAHDPKAASDVIGRSIDEPLAWNQAAQQLAQQLAQPDSQLSPVALASGPDDLPEDPTTDLCTCGHPRERHDAHGLRYCRATVSNDLRRGCICVEPTTESAGRR
jgi:hypothetical protein